MAATTLTSVINPTVYDKYLKAYMFTRPSLIRSGVVRVDTNHSIKTGGGNVWHVPHYEPFTTALQTPTADSSPTVYGITATDEIGVVVRRLQDFGSEILIPYITKSDPMAEFVNNQSGPYWAAQIEKIYAQLLAGVFGGPLLTTHCVTMETLFNTTAIAKAKNIMGEFPEKLDRIIMHQDVYHALGIDNTTMSVDALAQSQLQGGDWMNGIYAGMPVILNPRIATKNADSTYYTYICGMGALLYASQVENMTALYPSTKAGGTIEVLTNWAFSCHVFMTYYNTTAPTALGGATDAQLATTTSWTSMCNADGLSAIPMVRVTHTL
jgi:hypothetical protein